MHATLRPFGNSLGVIIPKSLLAEAELTVESGVEMSWEGTAIVLRKPAAPQRQGWGEAAQAVAAAGDDRPVMREGVTDSDLPW